MLLKRSHPSVTLTDCCLEECAEAGASIAMWKFSPVQIRGGGDASVRDALGGQLELQAYLFCCESETSVEDQ
jgi:hypothetical protein